jgi:L-alanine-DL-glutamate epimerase-like enolase superfamily enzyme
LKIERLEVVPYSLRFREPYVTARGRLERRDLVLFRLRADGLEGLGEGAPLSLRGGPAVAEIAQDLDERCRPLLEGTEFDPGDWSHLASTCEGATISRGALAAVEMALLDLAGKANGVPAWQLLGAAAVRPVLCNATLIADEPYAVAENALAHAERGFKTFKLKVGVDGDVDQVAAVRAALGPEARIRVDANGVWSDDQAVATLRELEPLDVELAEQPAATVKGLAAVRRETSVPVFADESVASPDDAAAAAAADACDGATVKIAKVGGVRAARAVFDVLPTYLSSALDGPVGIAAAAHLAQVLPTTGPAAGLAHGLATAELFDATIATRECRVENARLVPSDDPGFGVVIDDDALGRHRP